VSRSPLRYAHEREVLRQAGAVYQFRHIELQHWLVYTKAIEQLRSGKLAERIRGIYALEYVAGNFPGYHFTVIDRLSAFIRENSHDDGPAPGSGGAKPGLPIRPDIQAALTVIGRRDAQCDTSPINLTGADLTGADLTGADLTGADLTGADLTGADLTGADLTGADLTGARWPRDAAVPEGWKLDTSSGLLAAADTGSRPIDTAQST
jgi:hypothetical protein